MPLNANFSNLNVTKESVVINEKLTIRRFQQTYYTLSVHGRN